MRLKVRPPVSKQAVRKNFNRAPFHDKAKLADLRGALSNAVNDLETQNLGPLPNHEYFRAKWEVLAASLLATAVSVFGNSQRRHQDWFDSNNNEIQDIL